MCCLIGSNGCSVRLSANLTPSSLGHQAEGIAPLGKKMNAERKGAPVLVVASPFDVAAAPASTRDETSDENAGSATAAPSPRRKCLRLRPAFGPAWPRDDSEVGSFSSASGFMLWPL